MNTKLLYYTLYYRSLIARYFKLLNTGTTILCLYHRDTTTSNHLLHNRAISSCQGHAWCPLPVLNFQCPESEEQNAERERIPAKRCHHRLPGCSLPVSVAWDVPSSTLKLQVGEPREVSPWVIGAADSKTRPVPAVTSSSLYVPMLYTVNEQWWEAWRRRGRKKREASVEEQWGEQ